MKVVILGDTHMGARGGDLDFARYFNTFYRDLLYPYMLDNGIDTILQLGDFFDDQRDLDLDSFHASKPEWLQPIVDHDFKMFVLVGNHDIAYKNTLRVNSPDLILAENYPNNITVINKPTTIDLDGYGIDIVPWICKENAIQVAEFINEQKSSVLLGHFDIAGFSMQKGGQTSKKGMKPEVFEHYPFVFSGHFHTKSKIGNIEYLGTPYQMTWSDYGDPKGFHVFDTVAQTLTFVENTNQTYVRLVYQEGMQIDEEALKGKIVRLMVTDRGNLKKYNVFIEAFKSIDTKNTEIVEHVLSMDNVNESEGLAVDWIDDTPSFIKKVVDLVDTDVDKDKLKDYVLDLHERALKC